MTFDPTLQGLDHYWRIGKMPASEWIAGAAPDKVLTHLVRALDHGDTPAYRLLQQALADRLGVDPDRVFAENYPRKAARHAKECRERGDHPHADKVQAALSSLMYCANCGRPLVDPVSIDRGIGPDCWQTIDPYWRTSIERRLVEP